MIFNFMQLWCRFYESLAGAGIGCLRGKIQCRWNVGLILWKALRQPWIKEVVKPIIYYQI